MSDAVVIQPGDDDLSKPPDDLNDFHAWFKRGRPDLAFEALLNQITVKIGNEQTSQMLLKDQSRRDEALASRLEQIVFGLKGELKIAQIEFQEQLDHRFQAYNAELNDYRRQNNDLLALVEERLLAPFGEMVTRVGDLEYGYADLADRLDTALDPATPGATIAMVVIQDRVRLLTWLVWSLLAAVVALGALLIWHHWYIWERLR